VARRPWADVRGHGDPADRWATSWYEPQADDAAIARGIAFALSTPGVAAFCTPGDLGLLPRVLAAAAAHEGMADDERAAAAAAMASEDDIFPIPR
jgi:hypothetical protein